MQSDVRLEAAISRARAHIAAADSVFVLTGAGMSAESGLPTFRGEGGLWQTHRVEELASPGGFARDPELVWRWYNERRAAHAGAEPNAGHRALAALARRRPRVTLATQNVDSLHVRAGSRDVLELHGNLREARCDRCGTRVPLEGGLPAEKIAHGCGGRFRPDIVWFGESLPQDVWERAAAAARGADAILVIGTSGLVNPAASLVTRLPRANACVIEVNPEPTTVTQCAHETLRGAAAKILPAVIEP